MLKIVTITGADDATDPDEMIRLSQKYPFVEWGILFDGSNVTRSRFPSFNWMGKLIHAMDGFDGMNISLHLCGEPVRKFLVGDLRPQDLPGLAIFARRAQINTHAVRHVSDQSYLQAIGILADTLSAPAEIIFQLDGVNEHYYWQARPETDEFISVAGLHDLSHGAGLLPEEWPRARESWVGFAGGLGTYNLADQLPRIHEAANGQDYWIDMETQVRDVRKNLDLGAVETVLEFCDRFRATAS